MSKFQDRQQQVVATLITLLVVGLGLGLSIQIKNFHQQI
jgi:hypothetical protein